MEDDFADEMAVIEDSARVLDAFPYYIYADIPAKEQEESADVQEKTRADQVNVWLKTFGDMYRNKDGSPDRKKIEKDSADGIFYCRYDTYMKLSDYNHLRRMLGYTEVSLKEGEYSIHVKERIREEVGAMKEDIHIEGDEGELRFAGYYTEPFSQDGHNGGDYVIVVPDHAISSLTPYYAELAVDIEGKAPTDLGKKLDELTEPDEREEEETPSRSEDEADAEDIEADTDFAGHKWMTGNSCCGSDTIVVMSVSNMVRDNLIPEMKYLLSALIFPCFYIGLVFLCVALTVLSVHQLSDSAKYRFRYAVLKKLGMNRQEIGMVILKQLAVYYLCPVLLACVIGGSVSVFMSGKFIFYTGIHTAVANYFGFAFLLFFGIYALYFITTYVSFRRNVEV